ncbi:MAG: hypothetical protein M3258_02410 [Thermoproteota archaeon]|nr:hypothetical protein [Thermoproteota archaeon]
MVSLYQNRNGVYIHSDATITTEHRLVKSTRFQFYSISDMVPNYSMFRLLISGPNFLAISDPPMATAGATTGRCPKSCSQMAMR